MTHRPTLQTGGLPSLSQSEAAATASPARGAEMRKKLLTTLRPPPFVHEWDFWHDRQDRPAAPANITNAVESSGESYEARLRKLHAIADVREFWEVYNNFDLSALRLRDSVHLFHRGVKPVWEDPRNARGGAWTFRVPMPLAKTFWTELSLMAVGEKLQEAVESRRISKCVCSIEGGTNVDWGAAFKDDICGISLSVRTSACLIMVWNRDAEHTEGIERILRAVMEGLSEELRPRENSYYYKKHSEHRGFKAPETPSNSLSPAEQFDPPSAGS
jgi:Eukaryotic initiation factor 4E